MQTIDFHAHLLNPDVSFSRIYDKVALSLFANKLGVNKQDLIQRKYEAYVEYFMNNIQTSQYVNKSVLLPVDAVVNEDGIEVSRDKTVCSSNDDVYKEYLKYPNKVIPFFSINPNRKDALNLIDKYVALGFKGAKLLQNYWYVDINDKKFEPYFQKLKDYDLPIIIHTGSEFAVDSNTDYEKVDIADLAIKMGCKVVLAHFGVDIVMESKPSKLLNNFSFNNKKFGDDYDKTLYYLEKYDNVYADLSAIIALFRAKTIEDLALNQKHIHHKLLFGTDYPVPFSILFSYNSLSLKKRLELEEIKNPLDRYIHFLNEYFPEDSVIYTNWKKILKD
jgi:predicted TIM-barrel fold metal-dependent hydrolase